VVVAVSVVTTFLTPYMIKAADPAYAWLERRLPKQWARRLTHLNAANTQAPASDQSLWQSLLLQITFYTSVYSILSITVIAIMLGFVLPLLSRFMPERWADLLTAVATILFISPFLRSMIMKKTHSEEMRTLWTQNRINRLPLAFTVLARIIIAAAFIFYICQRLTHFTGALLIAIAAAAVIAIILSRRLKKHSIMLERQFVQNLRSREIEAEVHGRKRPLYEGRLLDRDIHISEFDVPEESSWAGHTLGELLLRDRFGVHISSILRGHHRMNIPTGDTVIFPGDRIQVIGDDEQLRQFGETLKGELVEEDPNIESREMRLRQMVISEKSPFVGKTLQESRLRDEFQCMVVGVEEGQERLTLIDPNRRFLPGDIVWIVGERDHLNALQAALEA